MRRKEKRNVKVIVTLLLSLTMVLTFIFKGNYTWADNECTNSDNFDKSDRSEKEIKNTKTYEEKEIKLHVHKDNSDIKVRKKFDIEILIDASGSMKENDPNMEKAKKVINNFIKERDPKYDRVGVTVFRGPSLDTNGTTLREKTIKTIHPLSNDLEGAIKDIDSINPGGLTPLLDGLDKAKDDLDRNKSNDSDEKILIVLGDGHPNIGPKRDYFVTNRNGISGDYYGSHKDYYPGYTINKEMDELDKLSESEKISFDEYIKRYDELEKKIELYPGGKKEKLSSSTINSKLKGKLYDNSKSEFYDLKYLVEKKGEEIKNSGYEVYSVFLNNEKPGSSSYKKFLDDTNENEKLFRNLATDKNHFLYADDLDNLTNNFKTINGSLRKFDYNIKDTIEDGYKLVPNSFTSSINGVTPKVSGNELTWKVNDVKDNDYTVTYRIYKNKAVKVNSIPEITGEDKTLKVNDSFDPMKGITGIDKEDGDVTNNIKVIENNVDTSKPGVYKVTYEVRDKDGAKSKKIITITVNKDDNTIKEENIPKKETTDRKEDNKVTPKKESTYEKTSSKGDNTEGKIVNNIPKTGYTGVASLGGIGIILIGVILLIKKR